MDLIKLIKNKKAKVAIIGMGYVGLPHAVEIAKTGFFVSGIDIQKNKVENLNSGKSYIEHIKDNEIWQIIQNGRFRAFNTHEPLKTANIIIICVPTPLDNYKIPDISYIKNSAIEIKKHLRKDKLIILESTTYPGTTEEVILPILEEKGLKAGTDFYLSFSPERIDPGNKMPISDITKIVGGVTKKCAGITKLFYSNFIKNIHIVSSPKVAEMTKLLENTYRLINISAVNELAMLCDKMGINIWETIDAAKTKPYGFQAFYPSAKVGGHCIPLDPFYLSWKARKYNFWARFIELAGQINEQMPYYTVNKINHALNEYGKSIKGSKILIFGVTYKRDINDSRESAALEIIPILMSEGASVDYFDPYISEIKIKLQRKTPFKNLENETMLKSVKFSCASLKKYDCVVILTDHSGFDYEEIARNSKVVIDTRNAVSSREHKNIFRFGS